MFFFPAFEITSNNFFGSFNEDDIKHYLDLHLQEIKNKEQSKDIKQDLILFNQKSLFFGGVNAVVKEHDELIAIADERREGVIL